MSRPAPVGIRKVKVDDVPFDDHPNNEPHVGCSFQIDFYGYDEGDLEQQWDHHHARRRRRLLHRARRLLGRRRGPAVHRRPAAGM